MIRPPISQVGCASASAGRDPGEVGAAAKRPAGGGQDEPLDRARALAAQQLEDRRVLGVDRQDPRLGRLGERRDELAADDEALLVGEREVDALAERDDRRPEAGDADDRVEDEVRARSRSISSRTPSSPARTSGPAELGRRPAAASGSESATAATPVSRACAREPLPVACRPRARRPRARPSCAITSSACSPIEPVEPRMRTRLAIEAA